MLSLHFDAYPDPALALSLRDLTVITDALRYAQKAQTSPDNADARLADDALSLEVRINDWADNMGVPVEE